MASSVVASIEVEGEEESEAPSSSEESPRQAQYRRWWQPVLDAKLDDPDQTPPTLFWPNNVRLRLPWPQTWILAYATDGGRRNLAVCTAGRAEAYQGLIDALEPEREEILAQLPTGSTYHEFDGGNGYTFRCTVPGTQFADDDARRLWLATTINAFVNVLRPRIKRLMEDRRGH